MDFCEEEFNKKALELFNISELLNDNWKINEKNEKFYLTKQQKISVKSKQETVVENVEDPSVAVNNPKEIISIEYHILFHPSYQVPVLFFDARSDGSLISLDELSKVFVEHFEFRSYHDEMQSVITQAEHPILFRPFFMLHPCKVNQVLTQFPGSKNFVLTFLTLFGPSVRLQMSPEYQKFFSEEL